MARCCKCSAGPVTGTSVTIAYGALSLPVVSPAPNYLTPTEGQGGTSSAWAWTVPADGTLDAMWVCHLDRGATSDPITYQTRVNGVATGPALVLAGDSTSYAADLSTPIPVVAGDRVSMTAYTGVNPGGIRPRVFTRYTFTV